MPLPFCFKHRLRRLIPASCSALSPYCLHCNRGPAISGGFFPQFLFLRAERAGAGKESSRSNKDRQEVLESLEPSHSRALQRRAIGQGATEAPSQAKLSRACTWHAHLGNVELTARRSVAMAGALAGIGRSMSVIAGDRAFLDLAIKQTRAGVVSETDSGGAGTTGDAKVHPSVRACGAHTNRKHTRALAAHAFAHTRARVHACTRTN